MTTPSERARGVVEALEYGLDMKDRVLLSCDQRELLRAALPTARALEELVEAASVIDTNRGMGIEDTDAYYRLRQALKRIEEAS